MIDDVALEDDGDAGSVLGMTFALGRMGLLIIDMGDAGKSCRRACPHLVKRTHPEVSARWTEGIAFAGMPASRHAATKSSRAIARGVIPVRAWVNRMQQIFEDCLAECGLSARSQLAVSLGSAIVRLFSEGQRDPTLIKAALVPSYRRRVNRDATLPDVHTDDAPGRV